MSTLIEKPTQENRILDVLRKRQGQWVNGRYFIQTMMISQAHARIWSLQQKGHNIISSDFADEFGFKSYKLLPEDGQVNLF
jgi:hypothetical protein